MAVGGGGTKVPAGLTPFIVPTNSRTLHSYVTVPIIDEHILDREEEQGNCDFIRKDFQEETREERKGHGMTLR